MNLSPDIDFVVAIPARFAATRLPGKPLRQLGGMPLVLHVVRRALAAGAREVWVASDDMRISEALRECGVQVAMTSVHHTSGSDRLAECAAIAGWKDDTIVVNLQGDEPFAPAAGIRAVATLLRDSGAAISTLAAGIEDAEQLFDPSVVKLVRAKNGDALYFSRAPIPWDRDGFARDRTVLPANDLWLRHIGIYGYRADMLKQFAAMPPGRLEQVESLEQLRALEAGLRIAVGMTPELFPSGVDTEEDLRRAERHLRSLQG
jgi:3-deoxy-manno-octulosonate cytidylyltransferase (CMP-KDO synthetase)